MRISRQYNREAYRIHFIDWHVDCFRETQNTQRRIYFCHVQYLLIWERPFLLEAVMGLPWLQSMWKAGFSSSSLTYRDGSILSEYRTQIHIWGYKEFVWMWGSSQLSVKCWRRVTAEVASRLLTPSFAEIESMSAESQHKPSVTTSDRFLLSLHDSAFRKVIIWHLKI